MKYLTLVLVVLVVVGCATIPETGPPDLNPAELAAWQYEQNGEVSDFASAARRLIAESARVNMDARLPIPVRGRRLGAVWRTMRRSWAVHHVELRGPTDEVPDVLEVYLRSAPVVVYVCADPEAVIPTPGGEPRGADEIFHKWAPGVYVHYWERALYHYVDEKCK